MSASSRDFLFAAALGLVMVPGWVPLPGHFADAAWAQGTGGQSRGDGNQGGQGANKGAGQGQGGPGAGSDAKGPQAGGPSSSGGGQSWSLHTPGSGVDAAALPQLTPIYQALQQQGFGQIKSYREQNRIIITARRGDQVRQLVCDGTTGKLLWDSLDPTMDQTQAQDHIRDPSTHD